MPDYKLDVIELGAQAIVLDKVRKSVTRETEIEPRMRTMTLNAFTRLAGQRFEPIHVAYPRDWWQALKQRWYPAWALARWPVVETRIDWTPEVIYPLIALPDEPRWEMRYRA